VPPFGRELNRQFAKNERATTAAVCCRIATVVAVLFPLSNGFGGALKAQKHKDIYPSPLISTPWHLDRVNQRNLPLDRQFEVSGIGSGVSIYVLDTGARVTHSAFEERAGFADIGNRGDLVGDEFGKTFGADDCQGHGTHMAALAGGFPYGLASGSEIRAIRVADCRGKGDPRLSVQAIHWLTEHAQRPAVVLISTQR